MKTYPPPPANVPQRQIHLRERILNRLEMDVAEIPNDDAATWELIRHGDADDIFGLTKDGIFGEIMARMDPETLEDLAVMVTLSRPNTICQELYGEYIARKNGKPWDRTGDTDLNSTRGLIVYREQAERLGTNPESLYPQYAAHGWARFAWTLAYLKANHPEIYRSSVATFTPQNVLQSPV